MNHLYDMSEEIRIASKSGFLTKEIWNEFYGEGKSCWRNRIWNRFLTSDIFKPHHSVIVRDIIVPNSKHPLVQKISGGEISHAPSIAQFNHDQIVMASFLKLIRNRTIASGKFESELKREDSRLRRGYRMDQKVKYPDLVVELRDSLDGKTIAIELELSRKEPRRYRQMMNTYMTSKQFSSVIFITQFQSIQTAIESAVRETFYPVWERPVGFVSLSDWLKGPSDVPVNFGKKIISLEKMNRDKSLNAS